MGLGRLTNKQSMVSLEWLSVENVIWSYVLLWEFLRQSISRLPSIIVTDRVSIVGLFHLPLFRCWWLDTSFVFILPYYSLGLCLCKSSSKKLLSWCSRCMLNVMLNKSVLICSKLVHIRKKKLLIITIPSRWTAHFGFIYP